MARARGDARFRRHAWRWIMGGLVVLLQFYGSTLVRLHRTVPDLQHEKSHHWQVAVARDQSNDDNTLLWEGLERQLVERDRVCGVVSNRSTKVQNHLRGGPETNEPLTLLESLRQPRNASNLQCRLPCPVSTQNDAKVAAVLVLDQQQRVHWRQLTVNTLKLLQTVDQVWVLMARHVWQDDAATEHDKLYRERFRPQPVKSSSRIHSLIVDKESWGQAIEQLDTLSNARTLVWIQASHNTTSSWKTFIHPRVEEWKRIPHAIHVSYQLHVLEANGHRVAQSSHNSDTVAAFGGCHRHLEPQRRSALVVPVTSAWESNAITALPYLHGLVHDKAWLCFWKHGVLQPFWQQGWRVGSVAATLWMTHLAGAEPLVTDETVAVEWVVDLAVPVLNYFGGASLPGPNMTAVSQQCGG